MIAAETDPVKLDRLSSARSRVFEQWRILANRLTPRLTQAPEGAPWAWLVLASANPGLG